MNKLATFTRKHPGLVDAVRRVMPLALKRKIGSALLSGAQPGTTVAKDGRKFVTIPDRVFLQVVYDGIFEPSLSHFIGSAIRKGDVCVDIGSNFGWFATLMAASCDRVIAYEPASRVHDIFQQNVNLNDFSNIDIRKKAVGKQSGKAVFVIEGDAERESALGHVAANGETRDGQTVEEVTIVRLDEDLSDEAGKISLIKLDAEGYELFAVQGAEALLSNEDPPILITEANRESLGRSGASREELCDELSRHGYALYGMNRDGTLYRDDGKAPALACLPPRGRFKDRIKA